MTGIPIRRSRDMSSSTSSSGVVRRRRLDGPAASERQDEASERKREEILSFVEKMRSLEEEHQITDLRSSAVDPNAVVVDEECRRKMCIWCYQVADHCNIRRDTVCVAMSYVDRYLCTDEGAKTCLSDRKAFQLAAMTSLYTSIKLFEDVIVEPRIMVELSRGSYTKDDFIRMEVDMLMALRWKVYRLPTPLSFVENFIHFALSSLATGGLLDRSLLSIWTEELVECSKFQTELAFADSSLAIVRPSIIAAASIANAFDLVTPPLQEYTAAVLCRLREIFLRQVEDLASIKFTSTCVANVARELRDALSASDYFQSGRDSIFSNIAPSQNSSSACNSQTIKRAKNCRDLSPRCASFEVTGTTDDEDDWN